MVGSIISFTEKEHEDLHPALKTLILAKGIRNSELAMVGFKSAFAQDPELPEALVEIDFERVNSAFRVFYLGQEFAESEDMEIENDTLSTSVDEMFSGISDVVVRTSLCTITMVVIFNTIQSAEEEMT